MSESKVKSTEVVDEVTSVEDFEPLVQTIRKLEESVEDVGYKRQITGRQVLMITFGAGIGTGFWVGMGSALRQGGPFGIVFAYTINAYIVYVMFIQTGEMTAYQPIHGGFINQIDMYLDKAICFAQGINFAFNWMIVLAAELTAGISILRYWDTNNRVTTAEYIAIFAAIYIAGNIWPIRAYGYIEYVQSFIKIVAMAGITLFMFIGTCGGLPNTGPIGYKFWKNPGWIRNGIQGIVLAFSQSGFSFGGGEHIAIVAGEVKNPRTFIPRCTQPIFWRLCVFFIGNAWLITMNVPYDDETLNNASGSLASPYIIAMKRGGVKILPDILNALILLSVISCGNSSVYIGSRSLVACADLKVIHPVFGKKDSKGRPVLSLLTVFVVGIALAFLNCSKTGEQVYNWFNSLCALNGYFTWLSIYWSHYRFRAGLKAQGINYKTLPLYDKFFPWTTYTATFIIIALFIGQFYIGLYPLGGNSMSAADRAENFFLTYLCVPLFGLCWLYYKLRFKTKLVKPEDMNFSYAKKWNEIEELRATEKKKPSRIGVFIERYLA
ncbi:hypothetical protein KL905_003997 [Ogataea polymorpha]|uniref:Amino acid permease/ SLC12A domain-containing protein n=1 Tax=Ogataea polymorpha TaxID=460523 RepID=A0A9P8P3X8_9ASCO|nr:hypothetical protein KL906_004166 [Ogataea polymorpha]KAG7918986.1 hypothetical protein KL905_003997 [Ogataea polymorpha]KAG7929263.1 hypothetical protein KL925_000005 [Ogataea polymorpha]KAH3665378.1 hypothetical protein OGATHE_004194 [Ogataea polymorpha]